MVAIPGKVPDKAPVEKSLLKSAKIGQQMKHESKEERPIIE